MSAIVAALQRLLSLRRPPAAAAAPACAPGDTLPWVFRSEAFAEDLGDAYRRA